MNRNGEYCDMRKFITYTVFVEGDDEKGVVPLRRTTNSLKDLLSPYFT